MYIYYKHCYISDCKRESLSEKLDDTLEDTRDVFEPSNCPKPEIIINIERRYVDRD